MSAFKKLVRYVPQFDGAVKGWAVNHITRNVWRVEHSMDINDCVQEAYLVFLHTTKSYPLCSDPRHFMKLFQTSWTRRFHDLSAADTRQRAREVSPQGKDFGERLIGDMANEGELLVMLRQAPRDVRMVLDLMLRAPQEVLDVALGSTRRDKRKRANGSERINRLLGLPLDQDTLGRVQDYFTSQS